MTISVQSFAPAIAQAAIGGAALLALAAAPPAEGKMLIVSLSGEDSAAIAGWAVGGGARIIGRGPIEASLIVSGRASDLAGAALRHGSIMVAAPAAGCGTGKAA